MEREGERDRGRDRKTDRKTDRDRQRQRKVDRGKEKMNVLKAKTERNSQPLAHTQNKENKKTNE